MNTPTPKPGLLDRLVVKLLNRPAVRAAVMAIVLDDLRKHFGMIAPFARKAPPAADVPPQRFPKGRWS